MRAGNPVSTGEWLGVGWRITVTGDAVHIARATDVITLGGPDAFRLSLRRRRFRLNLYQEGTPLVRLRGIKKSEATSLAAALLRLKFVLPVDDAVDWNGTVVQLLSERRTNQRWITREETVELIDRRPERLLID